MSGDFVVTAIDRTTLATDLLPLTKKQARIDFDDDDEFVVVCIQRAIALLEAKWGLSIFGADVDWSPRLNANASGYQIPVQPVSSFTVSSETEGGDISDQFVIRFSGETKPIWLRRIDGTPFPRDAEITLVIGFTAWDDIPPNALDGILRLASTLYEYRESIDLGSLAAIPRWLDDTLVGLWVPRC